MSVVDNTVDTPYERYRELMDISGIGDVTALEMVFSENEWWNNQPYSVEVRDLINASGLSSRAVLTISYYVQENFISNLTRYRIGKQIYRECVINPWIIIREIPYYTLDMADKLASYQGLPLSSPDRITEIAFNAVEKVLNDGGNTSVTTKSVRTTFDAMTNNVYIKKSDIFTQALDDLRDQQRVVIF